jgi:hypothetical protein
MPYVQRENGAIVGVYANRQEGYAVEELQDVASEVVAFLNPPPPVPPISRRQFFQQAAIAGVISESEALAAVTTGALPAAITAFVGTLPADQQFGAKMLFSVSEFVRSSPMANAFGQTLGMTPEQIDEFFEAAAAL